MNLGDVICEFCTGLNPFMGGAWFLSEAKLASFKTVGQIKALVHNLPGLLNSCGAFCKLRMCFPRSCYVID